MNEIVLITSLFNEVEFLGCAPPDALRAHGLVVFATYLSG